MDPASKLSSSSEEDLPDLEEEQIFSGDDSSLEYNGNVCGSDDDSSDDHLHHEFLHKVWENEQKQFLKTKKKADAFYRKKKFSQAAHLYNQIFPTIEEDIETENLLLDSLSNASVSFFEVHEYDKALSCLRKLFRSMPESELTAELYLRVAKCYLMTRQYERASFVTLFGLNKFHKDASLGALLDYLILHYRPSVESLRDYVRDLNEEENDLFALSEKIVESSDETLYLRQVTENNNHVDASEENLPGFHQDQSEGPSQDEKLDLGSVFLTIENAARAYRASSFGLAAHEFGEALSEAPHLNENLKSILTYCQSMAILKARSLDSIRSCKAALEALCSPSRPYVYFGLAKYLLALKKDESQVIDVVQQGQTSLSNIDDEKRETVCQSEILSELFPEFGNVSQLKILFSDLLTEVTKLKTPDAVCRLDNCSQILPGDLLPSRNNIFLTDIDFKGFYTLICTEKCSVDFHLQCWKHLKEVKIFSNDKDFLGSSCLTPDCQGVVVKIRIIKESGETKEIEVEDWQVTNLVSSKSSVKPKTRHLSDPELPASVPTENKSSAVSSKQSKKPVNKKEVPSSDHFEVLSSKKWPPDPSCCQEFVMPTNVQSMQELDALNMSEGKQQVLEELNQLMNKVHSLEKDQFDLKKKLDDAKIYGKRQSEEVARLKKDLDTERQTTNRLLHRNEQLVTENVNVKKSLQTLETQKDFSLWQMAYDGSLNYLQLLEYLHAETFLDNSPVLQRCIREYKLTVDRAKLQLEVLRPQLSKDFVNSIQLPVGLTETDYQSIRSELDAKILQFKNELRKNILDDPSASNFTAVSSAGLMPVAMSPPISSPTKFSAPGAGSLAGANSKVGLAVPQPGRGKLLEQIVDRVQEKYPSISKDIILDKINVVKQNNNGTIRGLTMHELVDRIGKLSQATQSEVGSNECVICFEDMKYSAELTVLQPCRHRFHKHCISSWLKEKRDCPFCRAYILPPDEFPQLQRNFFRR